jgi:site-specific DNA recombinase
VNLISVVERLDQTPQGKLMLYIIVGMNEFYSANLAQETMKGLKENAYKCQYNGGIPPRGYDINSDKTYRINSSKAESIRLIFRMYAGGCGYTEIIKELDRHGYKTKLGRRFGVNSLHDILINEKYCGTYVFNKSAARNVHGKMNRHKYKKENEIIKIPNGIPAIVSHQDWEAVQMRMKANKNKMARNKAKIEYLLTGKIYCGICGSAMTGEVRHTKDHFYAYYRCNRGKRQKDCTQHSIPKDLVEKSVIEQINNKIFSARNIDSICKRIFTSYKDTNHDSQITSLKKRIVDVDRKINNVTAAIADGVTAPEMKDTLNSLSKQKTDIKMQLYELEAIPDAGGKSFKEIKKEFMQFANLGALTPDRQKQIINNFISKVIVYPTEDGYKVRIIINSDQSSIFSIENMIDLPIDAVNENVNCFGYEGQRVLSATHIHK